MRDGSNGSYDLPANGRNLLPQWSVDLDPTINSTTPSSNGPDVDETGRFRLGTYAEDYALKADLIGFSQYDGTGEFDEAVHYDLNAFNVRFCVTPEYPEGTWAYFTSILEDGTPFYPYNVASVYFGDSSAAAGVTEIPTDEAVVTLYAGPTSQALSLEGAVSEDDVVTMVWNGVEGGVYEISESTDLETWTTPETFSANGQKITRQEDGLAKKFYILRQTGLAEYDTTEFSSGGGPGGGGPGGDGPGGGGPGGGGPP